MGIYIGLIIFILLLPFLLDLFYKDKEKKNNAIILIGMLAIFLVLALKGDVGSDISGYKEQYYISAQKAWNDFDYVYFESGYIILMKIFSKLGIDFQIFMIFIYALACIAMYLFIKKYSKNPTFSLIIFVCYQFFVFYISGVRQCIAMSICIIAYLVIQKNKGVYKILSFLLTFLAISIHQSAIIFLVVLIVSFIKSKQINIWLYGFAAVGSILIRPYVWDIVNEFFREVDVNTSISLGGNFIMLTALAVLMYLINSKTNILQLPLKRREMDDVEEGNNIFYTRIILFSLCGNILFSGHSMLRATMYLSLFLIPGLPNTTWRLKGTDRVVLEIIAISCFVALFYFTTLVPNQLELCPYIFFWE